MLLIQAALNTGIWAGCCASLMREMTADRTAVITVARPLYSLLGPVVPGAAIKAICVHKIGLQAQPKIAPPASFDSML